MTDPNISHSQIPEDTGIISVSEPREVIEPSELTPEINELIRTFIEELDKANINRPRSGLSA